MKKYYVYIYLNPEISGSFNFNNEKFDFEPFYVGKGTGNRCYYHLMATKRNITNNNPFYNKINYLKKINIKPIIKIVKYFNNEKEAYEYETHLITLIGSNFIDEIKNGPLKNTCLIAIPPSLKGKTYEDIYGIERGIEQKRIRSENQKAVGGYFKGRKHSEESKKKTSLSLKGRTLYPNGMPISIKNNIAKAKKEKNRVGRFNKNSKHYQIISPSNEIFDVYGVFEIKEFAKKHNISVGSLQKTFLLNTTISRGKTKGWTLIHPKKN